MSGVKAKKYLGQHFLNDEDICQNIVNSLTGHGGYSSVVEVGPGSGAITKYLVEKDYDFSVVEIDTESVTYLSGNYPDLTIREEDFLKMDLHAIAKDEKLAVIGNFPYNISSQIMFKVYDDRNLITEVVGMFQKEVAERIAEKPGSKKYGILSVLLQGYYDIEYLLTVEPEVFDPPPKVKSGVIRLKRNDVIKLDCDEKLFKIIVKTGFGMRRKTLRNSLKGLLNQHEISTDNPIFNQRPEQLSVAEFVAITKMFE